MRRGFTLAELVSVMTIAGILTSVALPPLRGALDRAAVREGVERLAAAHATARQLAVTTGALTRLEVDPVQRSVTVSRQRALARWDTVATYPLGSAAVQCSNRVLAFSPIGLGFGLSNTRVIFSRGTAADTVTTSRTGRLRR